MTAHRDLARQDLGERQAELVAALVAGAPLPGGFDAVRLDATRRALLRKRAGIAAGVWPLLAASLGAEWKSVFAAHHDGHESAGALRDGWDVARALRARGELAPAAAVELGEREAALHYDGHSAPRPRRFGRARLMLRSWVPQVP
ncbi:hypothetical protein [Pseudonocardia sp. GCM10023141]|uniref:hypothetical protein n=1 Tax=Pseudonocardia sp. GCM10023141 TaxID=3252653 RepID=UPI00360BF1A3